jgi:hypothetical protein
MPRFPTLGIAEFSGGSEAWGGPNARCFRAKSRLVQTSMQLGQNRGFPPTGVCSGTWFAYGNLRQHQAPHSLLQTKGLSS